MTIAAFRHWIARRPIGWSLAILLAAAPALGVCAPMAMAMPAEVTAGMPAGTQHNMPAPCCVNPDTTVHAIAVPSSEAPLHPLSQPVGHGAAPAAPFIVPGAGTDRTLRPPIRAPAAPSCPLYLRNCALLN